MDKDFARRNLRTGLIAAAVSTFMFAMTFLAAYVYIQ